MSRSGEDHRKWNRGAGEKETIPSFVFFTQSPGEGFGLGWRRGGIQGHLPWLTTPVMTRGCVGSRGLGVRGVQEGPSQEKRMSSSSPCLVAGSQPWNSDCWGTELCGGFG